jgi:hypothetical protein
MDVGDEFKRFLASLNQVTGPYLSYDVVSPTSQSGCVFDWFSRLASRQVIVALRVWLERGRSGGDEKNPARRTVLRLSLRSAYCRRGRIGKTWEDREFNVH